MNKKAIVMSLTFLCLLASQGQADNGHRDLLIEKLEKISINLSQQDPSKSSVNLRLADLYSERARVEAQKELESACETCIAGKADREKALRYYSEVLGQLIGAQRDKVLLQMGHLYQLIGQQKQAIHAYEQISKREDASQYRADAHLALAEIQFKQRDYKIAKSYYQKVLDVPTAGSRGLAAYRSAWCSYYMGEAQIALQEIVALLREPSLLARSGASQQVDPQFHDEVTRDYVTFLASQQVTQTALEQVSELSPSQTRLSHFISLAADLERLGKKQDALLVWKYVYPQLDKPEDRVQAQVAQAQIYFDLGDHQLSLQNFSESLLLAQQLGSCVSVQCEELRRRSRQFVVSWNQAEKNKVSEELYQAFVAYVSYFPQDIEMHMMKGQVAEGLQKFSEAIASYRIAAEQLAQAQDVNRLEVALLKVVEVAEVSKASQMLSEAYSFYLQKTMQNKKTFEVKYQQARLRYEQGAHAQAAVEFEALALDTSGPQDIRKQAADLALDALALEKREADLQVLSAKFAQVFTAQREEYLRIAQKSILNQSAKLAEQSPQEAFEALNKFQTQAADPQDQLTYLKNKLILAQRLGRYTEAYATSDALLALPHASAEDVEYALGQKAKLAELLLDFSSSVAAYERIQKGLKPDEKALKLAILAELAGQDPTRHYRQFIQHSKDAELKVSVLSKLILKSPQPEKIIKEYSSVFKNQAEALGQIYLELFATTQKNIYANSVLSDKNLQKTLAGRILAKRQFLLDYQMLKQKVTSAQMDYTQQKKMAQDIKTRISLLSQVEKLVLQAIQHADWTEQLVSIDLLARESERFYQELMSAPLPEGLDESAQMQYMTLLGQQAMPYQVKAIEAKNKVEQFWQQPQWFEALEKSRSNSLYKSILALEAEALLQISKNEGQQKVQNLLSQLAQETDAKPEQLVRMSASELQAARERVIKTPYSAEALTQLKEIESKMGNHNMAQYLEARLLNLSKGVQQ